jgi:Amt family ammonium transporter
MRRRFKEMVMKTLCTFLALWLFLAFAGIAFAQDKPASTPDKPAAEAKAAAAPDAKKDEAKPAAAPAPTPNKGDVAWMLTSTALVLMMSVPALALFYGGMVRSKNALSMLMQVFVVFSLVTVLWCIYGYSLAFTEGNKFFGGWDRLFLKGATDAMAATFSKGVVLPELVYVAFQSFPRSLRSSSYGLRSATRRSPIWCGTGRAPTPTHRRRWSMR